MAEKLEDLNLPNMSVMRIIKEALPENINVGKDARSALSRAASVFVLYVTSQASNEAQKENRKTLLGKDILSALSELEFEHFIESLEEALEEYKNEKAKKTVKTKKSDDGIENNSIETEDINETIELLDDE